MTRLHLNELWRQFLLGTFPGEPYEWDAPDSPGWKIADSGLALDPSNTSGRIHHSRQAAGLESSEIWKIEASLDGVTFAQIGSDVTADGFATLPDGVYGWIRARQSTAVGALDVQYVGAAGAAAMTVSDGHLVVATTGAVDDLDLTLSDYADSAS